MYWFLFTSVKFLYIGKAVCNMYADYVLISCVGSEINEENADWQQSSH